MEFKWVWKHWTKAEDSISKCSSLSGVSKEQLMGPFNIDMESEAASEDSLICVGD
jgi:hypothetical protein